MTKQEKVDQLRRELAELKLEATKCKTPHQTAQVRSEIQATVRMLIRLLDSDPSLR